MKLNNGESRVSGTFIFKVQLSLLLAVLFSVLSIYKLPAQILTTGTSAGNMTSTGASLREQGNLSPAIGSYDGNQTFMALSARGGWRLPDFSAIKGSPYLHSEYSAGYVRLKSGFGATAMIKFNLYGNEILFSNNGNELALDSVDYVSYEAADKDGKMGLIRLKSGFPPIGKLNQSTIYQLLDSGVNLQFLKYSSQHIDEVKALGMAPYKEFITKEEYYIHIPGEGIKKIKADKRSVLDALPQYAAKIEELVKQKNLNLKKETDLITLIAALNNLRAF